MAGSIDGGHPSKPTPPDAWRFAPAALGSRHDLGVLVAALAWLCAFAWARPLAIPDEGRYVGVAWSMLTRGDWVVPTLNGLPYFHKPPLFYWITAASVSLFGPSEWAARAAPLLGAAAGTIAVFLFARRWWGPVAARAAVLVLATQPLVFVAAQFANLDMLVAGCIAVTVLAFAHVALIAGEGGPRPKSVLATAYAFAALGLLAKGLIGVVLPAGVLLVWLAGSGRIRAAMSLPWWPGLALFAAIGLPWFAAMQWRYPGFAHYFFVVQHVSRYSQGGFNNAQPWWFFLAVIAVLALPWSAWLVQRRRPGTEGAQSAALSGLMWTWIAFVTVFFSIPQSKLVGYILPVTWPLALLVARRVSALPPAGRPRRWLWPASLVVGSVAGVAIVALAAAHPVRSTRDLGRALAAQMSAGDRVVFVEGAFFDLPFYARLRGPVWIVDHWNDPRIATRDNWRKELADAARFAPAVARDTLIASEQFAQVACTDTATWIVARRDAMPSAAASNRARMIASQGRIALWRVPPDVSRGACGGTPSAS